MNFQKHFPIKTPLKIGREQNRVIFSKIDSTRVLPPIFCSHRIHRKKKLRFNFCWTVRPLQQIAVIHCQTQLTTMFEYEVGLGIAHNFIGSSRANMARGPFTKMETFFYHGHDTGHTPFLSSFIFRNQFAYLLCTLYGHGKFIQSDC